MACRYNPILQIVLFICSTFITTAEAAEQSAPQYGQPINKQATSPSALTPELPMFKFGGFGTLGVTHSTQDLGDYVPDSSHPSGSGRSSNWSATNNSRAAVHMNATFTPKVSALLQIDSEYRHDGTYTPEIEWISVKYAFTPNFYIRAGRIVLPTFMDSDSRDVGYSYVWVHPPVDLYHQLSIPSSDGVDAMYRSEIGEAGNSIRFVYGTTKTDRPTSTSSGRGMWGIFDTLEYGPATFHFGYQERESSSENHLTGVTSPWVLNSDLSLGASYDPGDWFVISEWIKRQSTYKVNGMYISAGYRVNKFTPYTTYSMNTPGSYISGYPLPTTTAAQIASSRKSQSTVGLGMRWDFMRNYDFKIQYDRVTLGDNSNGYLINMPAGDTSLYGTSFYVITAVVDFVF
jgi:hypothetical protein